MPALLTKLVHLALTLAALVPAPTVALTFDDGPGPATADILQVLVDHDAVATFFVVGDQVPGREHLLADMVEARMSVQWHSATHPDLTGLTETELAAQLVVPESVTAAGASPSCLRPPYGATNRDVVHAAAAAGLDTVLWDVDPRDWAATSSEQIVDAVMDQVRPGSVVLLHARPLTAEALPDLLYELHGTGFRTVLTCS